MANYPFCGNCRPLWMDAWRGTARRRHGLTRPDHPLADRVADAGHSSAGMREQAKKLSLAGLSIRVPHFSQVTRPLHALVTVTSYLAPQRHSCVPVNHSTNSVMSGMCAASGSEPDYLSGGLPKLDRMIVDQLRRLPESYCVIGAFERDRVLKLAV